MKRIVVLCVFVLALLVGNVSAKTSSMTPGMVMDRLSELVMPSSNSMPDFWSKAEYEFDDVAEIDGDKIVMTIREIDRNLGSKVKVVIDEAEKKYIKHIVLKIQSFGGSAIDVLDALILFQYWSEKEGNILETRVEPHAFSAGFFLCISGDKGHRYGTPVSMFQWHEGSIFVMMQGRLTATDANNMANLFNTMESIMNGWIALKTDMTKEDLRLGVRKGDMWMTAQQALEFGFIDKIVTWDTGGGDVAEMGVE